MKMLKLRQYREDISSINRIICKKSGVSLVEIIVAFLILALAALPAVGTFSTYYSASTKQMEHEMALKIAESVINLMNTVSYDMIIDKSLNTVPLDIQTPNGTVQGNLVFKSVYFKALDEDGNTPQHPDNLHLRGICEDIQINRIKYNITVDIIREFRPQIKNPQKSHKEAMDFYYFDYSESKLAKYSSFDFAFVFNVTVGFGKKTKPIRLSSFRADMVR